MNPPGMKSFYSGTNSFLVNVDEQYLSIHHSDVLYFKACQNYVQIVTARKRYLLRATFKELLQELRATQFIQVHRSFIIPLNKVTEICKDCLKLKNNDQEIKIGRAFRKKLDKHIQVQS